MIFGKLSHSSLREFPGGARGRGPDTLGELACGPGMTCGRKVCVAVPSSDPSGADFRVRIHIRMLPGR